MSEENTCNCPCGCDNPLEAGTCVDCSENTGHQNNNDLDEYRYCDVCKAKEDDCDCDRCERCEVRVENGYLYEGRCPTCEDQQMVRSIW